MPIGVFECKNCGFIYGRKGPDKNSGDSYRKTEVLSYGELWNERFTELWRDNTVSKSELKVKFETNHRGLEREASRLGLGQRPRSLDIRLVNLVKQYAPNHIMVRGSNFLETCREAWLAILDKHSNLPSRVFNSGRFKTLRQWLIENDPEWLVDHPFRSMYQHLDEKYLNLSEHDDHFAEEIRVIAHEISLCSEPIEKITLHSLFNSHDFGPLIANNLEQLPKTKQALLEVAEDPKAFIIRRINMTAEKYHVQGRKLSYNKLMNLARVRVEWRDNPDISAVATAAVARFHSE